MGLLVFESTVFPYIYGDVKPLWAIALSFSGVIESLKSASGRAGVVESPHGANYAALYAGRSLHVLDHLLLERPLALKHRKYYFGEMGDIDFLAHGDLGDEAFHAGGEYLRDSLALQSGVDQ